MVVSDGSRLTQNEFNLDHVSTAPYPALHDIRPTHHHHNRYNHSRDARGAPSAYYGEVRTFALVAK